MFSSSPRADTFKKVTKASCTSQAAQVEIEDISRAYTLFVDVKRSTEYMMEHQDQYMYNEVPELEGEAMTD